MKIFTRMVLVVSLFVFVSCSGVKPEEGEINIVVRDIVKTMQTVDDGFQNDFPESGVLWHNDSQTEENNIKVDYFELEISPDSYNFKSNVTFYSLQINSSPVYSLSGNLYYEYDPYRNEYKKMKGKLSIIDADRSKMTIEELEIDIVLEQNIGNGTIKANGYSYDYEDSNISL